MKILSVGATCCHVCVNGTCGMAMFPEKWYAMFHKNMDIIVANFTVSWKDGVVSFQMNQDLTKIYLCTSENRGNLNAVELFAGLGGWSEAASAMNMSPVLLIDSDENVAYATARKLGIGCMKSKEYVDKVLETGQVFRCVLHDDVNCPDTWVAIGLVNVSIVLGSPPCQPWSTAGAGHGLRCPDGQVCRSVLSQAVKLGVVLALIENVPGLPRHQDFRELISEIEKSGLKLVLHGVFDCARVLPVQRDRWLGTFVNENVPIEHARQFMANSIAFTDRAFEPVAKCPTISQADAEQVNMSETERRQLVVSEDLMNMMSMLEYAPQWLKNRLQKIPNPSADQVLNARVVINCQQFIGFMAMYGKQHELPVEMLRCKGLQTMLFRDAKGIRYISPWEMIASMGYSKSTVMSSDISVSWRMAGNGLSVAHAWLQLHKTHVLLGPLSPFTPQGTQIQQVEAFQANAIKMSQWIPKINGHFWELEEIPNEPAAKKIKVVDQSMSVPPTIPGTVPFEIEEEDVVATSHFVHMPEFSQVNDPRGVAVFGNEYGGGMVTLQHCQNNWIMFVNTNNTDAVGKIICKALPHANENHFEKIMFDNCSVAWNQSINCKPVKVLSFCPVFAAVTCREESLKIALSLQADTTWTAKAAIAYSAAKIGCSPDALVLTSQQLPVKEDDYLFGYQTTEFQLKFKACLPGYVSWEPRSAEVADVGMAPVPCTMRRWFARHPTRKVTRTVCAKHNTSVVELVQQLFPDIHATTTWNAFQGDDEIAGSAKVNDFENIQIQWNGFRPLRVTDISCVRHHGRAIDSPTVQLLYAGTGVKRHIRSPFKIRHDEVTVAKDITIAEIAASFMTVAQLQVSIICVQGSVVVDPMTRIDETSSDGIFTFRICPLLGGGKGDAKTRITEMLKSRGVPEDRVEERVKSLFSKVSPDKFKLSLSDDAFWTQVKTVASENKFRLITLDELKAFQSAKQKNKLKSTGSDTKPKIQTEQFQVDASRITIDPSHFSAGGEAVALIETTRFGPDQSGMCVVNSADAKKWATNGVKSCDPLAMLVVGKGCHEFGEVLSIPAYTLSGSPIIVQGCLMQFGDVPISFDLKIPSVVVDQVASTTIEFTIFRNNVTSWDDVSVPLHYIGVHIPELRGSNLLATWSIKAWNLQQVTHVSKADHWHGFFRIADNLLCAVLGRSGVAGIFLNPKNPERKHDPRFVTISLPNGHLSEVLAKAETTPRALGVAKRDEVYCIRCKREDADQLRAALMPETAYVETASFSDEETLYILSNVPQINRDELSLALGRAGWNANAIKPQGMKKWLVASKHDPPTCHLGINGMIVVVEKMKKHGTASQPVTMVAREFRVDTIRDQQSNLVQVSTTSRIAEFKAQIDDQIAAVVDQKLAGAHARIEELQSALQDVKDCAEKSHASITSDMGQMKQEQTFTRQKLQEVETSVATSGQAIIQQMQSMFSSMQSSLEKTMQQNMNGDPDKRQRVDETGNGRADPFATKS